MALEGTGAPRAGLLGRVRGTVDAVRSIPDDFRRTRAPALSGQRRRGVFGRVPGACLGGVCRSSG